MFEENLPWIWWLQKRRREIGDEDKSDGRGAEVQSWHQEVKGSVAGNHRNVP